MVGLVGFDEPSHKGAHRTDPEPAGAGVIQGPAHEPAAEALALPGGGDLGAEERDDARRQPVGDKAGPLAVGSELVAGGIRVVAHSGLHTPQALRDRPVSIMSTSVP